MPKYTVYLGSRRYVTEKTVPVEAKNSEQACNIAISHEKRMRYAIARRVQNDVVKTTE